MCQQCVARINIIENIPCTSLALGQARTADIHTSEPLSDDEPEFVGQKSIAAGDWCLITCNDPDAVFFDLCEPAPFGLDGIEVGDPPDDSDANDNLLALWLDKAEAFTRKLLAQTNTTWWMEQGFKLATEFGLNRSPNMTAVGMYLYHHIGCIQLSAQTQPESEMTYLPDGTDPSSLADMLYMLSNGNQEIVLHYANDDTSGGDEQTVKVVAAPCHGYEFFGKLTIRAVSDPHHSLPKEAIDNAICTIKVSLCASNDDIRAIATDILKNHKIPAPAV